MSLAKLNVMANPSRAGQLAVALDLAQTVSEMLAESSKCNQPGESCTEQCLSKTCAPCDTRIRAAKLIAAIAEQIRTAKWHEEIAEHEKADMARQTNKAATAAGE